VKFYIGRVMPKFKGLHRDVIKTGRLGAKGGNEQNRGSGGRFLSVGGFRFWSEWPLWKRFSLLAIGAALGLVAGTALFSPLYSHPPANPGNFIPNPANQPSPSSAQNAPDNAEIGEFYKIAKKALEAGQLEEAAAQYRKILEINPSSEDSHFGLAVALARQNRDDEAVQEYQEALRLMPNYAEVHNNLGNLLAKQGKLTEAIDHFQTALKITPDYASALNNMGTVLARQGKFDEARQSFEKAIKASPDYAAAHFNLGASLMRERNPAAAAREFEETLRLQPEFQRATDALALARKQADDPQGSANSGLGPTPP